MNKLKLFIFAIVAVGLLAACSSNSEDASAESTNGGTEQAEDKGKLTIGATAGPYSDMVTKAIKPILEEQGYTIEVREFSDYVQPNLALGNGSIDANVFQHIIYMNSFAEGNNLELSDVIAIPTAPMGIYSKQFDTLENIEEGAEIAIPNDPTNLARALLILEREGLITISEDVDPLTMSEKDVKDNYKNLQFRPIEAAQLPRTLDSVALAAVPGNFALAANMELLDALKLETLFEDYQNRVVVNTSDLDEQFVKDIQAAVESVEFEQVIDAEFQGFGKPEWMENK
ncbi:MetQ/NlpA family ABC transporter substrate-binding protein [Alkalihalobacterium alkalinitrilicum]|uniref:MetQ/NlpA family ABC transporter substrate-binding protein n=1 Tax=Alkalihalobacterium alkalinitrilicum TaxID=427920 RepID=UPI0009959E31|nr:MetQ/NlpA family ABC transporter substrate-binding protein [Alkalihalobacterium alkalinitrilicum]